MYTRCTGKCPRPIQGACREYATDNALALTDWDGPFRVPIRTPGDCTFQNPATGEIVYLYDSEVPRGVRYYGLVTLASVVSVVGLALTLLVAQKGRKALGFE